MNRQEWKKKILETLCGCCKSYDNGECTLKCKEKCQNHWYMSAIYTQIVEPLERKMEKGFDALSCKYNNLEIEYKKVKEELTVYKKALDDIAVKFDELGFEPTTLVPPEMHNRHFKEWFADELKEVKQ